MAKRIAALTRVRNDEFFLHRWVDYYSRHIGRDNLFIYFDGLDQKVPDFCADLHTELLEHVDGPTHKVEKIRIDVLSEKAAGIFALGYDLVIGTDVDEFLAVDPKLGVSLVDFLSAQKPACGCPSISPLGVDVGQKMGEEGEVDPSRLFLEQRRYAKLSTRYSKSTVLTRPVQWGSGFHRTRYGNFHIVPDLYLFHFGCVDLERLRANRFWSERHARKRAGTIYLVSEKPAREWDKTVGWARKVQNIVRSPLSWNKPSMAEARIVVRIPERFEGVI